MADISYTIVNRDINGKKAFYVKYKHGDERWSSLLSVSKIAKELDLGYPKKLKRRDAERICIRAVDEDYFKNRNRVGILLKDYLLDYWNFNGVRITRLNKRRKNSISQDYAKGMQANLKNHIIPLLPKNIQLSEVTPKLVRDVSDKLLDRGDLSNGSVAKFTRTLSTPLKEAFKQGKISKDPTSLLESIDEQSKARGILTQAEFLATLNHMAEIAIEEKSPPHAYLAVKLAASSGMRMSEIFALTTDNIEIMNKRDARILIKHAMSKTSEMKIPKGKKERETFITTSLAEELILLASKNPLGENLIFWNIKATKSMGPVSSGYVRGKFYEALYDVLDKENGFKERKSVSTGRLDPEGKEIYAWEYDCTEDEDGNSVRRAELVRRERNIVFHSFRHYYVTKATGSVFDESLLRKSVGHSSSAMTDAYTHITEEKARPLLDVARDILGE